MKHARNLITALLAVTMLGCGNPYPELHTGYGTTVYIRSYGKTGVIQGARDAFGDWSDGESITWQQLKDLCPGEDEKIEDLMRKAGAATSG